MGLVRLQRCQHSNDAAAQCTEPFTDLHANLQALFGLTSLMTSCYWSIRVMHIGAVGSLAVVGAAAVSYSDIKDTVAGCGS